MNNKMFTGSICLSDLIEQANRGHSAFVKAQNKKIYLSCIVWENEEPDKFGNTISFQLSSLKEKRDTEGRIYFGNAKPFEKTQPQPLGAANISIDSNSIRSAQSTGGTDVAQDPDESELPF